MRYSLNGSEIFTATYMNSGVIMIHSWQVKQVNKPATKTSKQPCQRASELASKLDKRASQPASKQAGK